MQMQNFAPASDNLGSLQFRFRQQTTQVLGSVSSIDFCTTAPHDYCVSAGTRLHVFDGATSAIKRQLTRFRDKAYSGSFRQDGRLLVAGGEDSVVQVFDAGSRTLLRQFKGHKAPVHVSKFAADQLHVLSGGDDGLVALWDVTTGQQVCSLRGHTDYVRTAAGDPANPDMWATGGYDHACRLWDVRQQRCLATVDHGAPVEAAAFFPAGSILVTAGGTDICIWHMLGCGRLMQRITGHQKTVTSVLVAALAGHEPHLVSAGLDGHVRVYDMQSYRPHTLHKYPVPVMSLAASPARDLLVVGMSDGTLSLHRRKQHVTQAAKASRLRWRPDRVAGARAHYSTPKHSQVAQPGDTSVARQPKVGILQHEELLLKFRFGEALEAALATQRAEIVEHVLDTLLQQQSLEATLAAAPGELVASLLQHCRRQVNNPKHMRAALTVVNCTLNSCGSMIADEEGVQEQLARLRNAVAEEVHIQEQLMVVKGMISALTVSGPGTTPVFSVRNAL